MSDAYYQEVARRRARRWWILGGAAAVIGLVLLGARGLLYDPCTQSFDRSPRGVVLTYVADVSRGNATLAQECWEQNAYFDLEAGCSEICLSRLYGKQLDITAITVGEQYLTADVRTNRVVKVSATCEGGGSHLGEIVLDTVGPNLSWKHWQIVRSSFGGTLTEAWCQ